MKGEGADGGVLQQDPTSSPGKQIRVYDYVDGKTVTIFKWLGNRGHVALTPAPCRSWSRGVAAGTTTRRPGRHRAFNQ